MCHICLQYAADEEARQNALQPGAVGETGDRPVWSLEEIIGQLDEFKLTIPGEVIKYAFPTDVQYFYDFKPSNGEEEGFSPLNSFQQTQARLAYSLWDDLIASSIEEVEDPPEARITMANTSTGVGWAHAAVSGGGAWLGSMHDVLQAPETGGYGFLTVMHEIGHSLGLSHSALHAQDSHMYSVMSYQGGATTGADHFGADLKGYSPQTPMLHDILAIQSKYGADMSTRTEDTVYGFNSNTNSPIFDFEQNANPILTIWDAGGIDTLDLSGFAPGPGNLGSIINLAPGSFSDTAAMTNNIAIAYGAWIENATGGRGNDTITGNKLDNRLIGNGGHDELNGADGDDYLDGGSGRDRLQGGAGDDILVYDAFDRVTDIDGGSGTDLLLIKDGRLPTYDLASRNIEFADHVQTDWRGTAPWSTKTDHYDASWRKLSQEGEAKNGESWKSVWDVNNEKWWKSYTFTYDDEGQRYQQTGERDAGTTWRHTYDVDDNKIWARQTENFDAQGRLFNRGGELDSGETWSQFLDAADTYWWTQITSSYNAEGQRTVQSGERDNGGVWTHVWDVENTAEWSRQTQSEDLSDLTWWRENTLYYNEANQVFKQAGVRDDGDIWEHSWDRDGSETWHRQTLYRDVQDSRDWFERVQTFDQNGTLLSTSYVDDIA